MHRLGRRTASALSVRGIVVALTSIALALASPAFAAAEPADDLSRARSELSRLTDELELAQSAADETADELASTQERIVELEDQITENEQVLGDARDELTRHVSESYKTGSASLLSMVLSSESFGDLVLRIYYANKVSAAESERVEAVRALQDELASQREELTERESELTELVEQQRSTASELESSLAAARSYVDGLSAETRQALEAEREQAADDVRDDPGADAPADPAPDGSDESGEPDKETPGSGGSGGSTAPSGNLTQAQRSIIVQTALSQVGVDYDYGAMSPGVAFDCSGLTTYAYSRAGISIPRSSRTQYDRVSKRGNLKTSTSALVAGDLVFYGSGGRVSHVAVYIGGGEVCHASDYGVGVIVSKVSYRSGFMGGGSPV